MAHAHILTEQPDDPLSAREARRREQAARVGHFTEAEVAELTGYSPGTLKTYRQRGVGLPWVRLGPEVLYPCESVRKHLADRVRHPRTEAVDAL